MGPRNIISAISILIRVSTGSYTLPNDRSISLTFQKLRCSEFDSFTKCIFFYTIFFFWNEITYRDLWSIFFKIIQTKDRYSKTSMRTLGFFKWFPPEKQNIIGPRLSFGVSSVRVRRNLSHWDQTGQPSMCVAFRCQRVERERVFENNTIGNCGR